VDEVVPNCKVLLLIDDVDHVKVSAVMFPPKFTERTPFTAENPAVTPEGVA
jgi:hypothetical protein